MFQFICINNKAFGNGCEMDIVEIVEQCRNIVMQGFGGIATFIESFIYFSLLVHFHHVTDKLLVLLMEIVEEIIL